MINIVSIFVVCFLSAWGTTAFTMPGMSSPSAPLSPKTSLKMSSIPTEGNGGGVVITGSAGGVGYAYAGEFMERGYDVVICDIQDCSMAAKSLEQRYPNGGKVYHTKCDVSDLKSVQKLGDFASSKLGTIGYWINNAGVNGGRRALAEVPFDQVGLVVKVNLLGTLYCTKVAMEIMGKQAGYTGHIFNTVGSGVKGGGTPGYACYGATKRGLPQLTASLVDELEKGVQGYDKIETPGNIQVHNLSPGMVFTKLLLDNSTPELREYFVNSHKISIFFNTVHFQLTTYSIIISFYLYFR